MNILHRHFSSTARYIFLWKHIASLRRLTQRLSAMAPTKKSPGASKTRSSSSQPSLKKVKGENFYRDAKTVNRLKMLNSGKAVRDRDGKIIQAAAFQKGEDETKPGRIQPDRKWFGGLFVQLCACTPSNDVNFQEIPGSFRKLLSTTSGQVSDLERMIHTLFFFVGISCRWRCLTMQRTQTCAK